MKAKQLLGETDAEVTERQYFKQKPTVDEIRALAALLPGGVRDILSTRSRKYAELNLAEKSLTDDEVVELLAAEPGLWRRPIVVRGDRAVVGFDAKNLEALLS
ncbi:MAG TPA: ArsC/Spx/MgsR family protein [Symbiobacteriaceae bacterium]|nr:ArsC/Spx/MgsR family protein [Symbiobacteriaceae bacterium]